MSEAHKADLVRCWEERVVIPTYPVQAADLNPMFLEKRVYQGSSGKVYPNAFTDRVALEKVDTSYRAIHLENEFIRLMILPEIGGRIHSGLDKTNQYDFFLSATGHQAGTCWPIGTVDIRGRRVQLASTPPPLHLLACPCNDRRAKRCG